MEIAIRIGRKVKWSKDSNASSPQNKHRNCKHRTRRCTVCTPLPVFSNKYHTMLQSSMNRQTVSSTSTRQCAPCRSVLQAPVRLCKCKSFMQGSDFQNNNPAPEPVPNFGREEIASRMSAAISKLSKAKQKVGRWLYLGELLASVMPIMASH